MTSKRNIGVRVDDDVLLDAARDCVLSVGVRRTTLTDIAKRADASRMTVYRRFPNVASMVAALMTREFGAVLSITTAGDNARERLVASAVDAARQLVDHPLLRSVLERDAELLLPYLVQRVGSTQQIAEKFITGQLAEGHSDGSIRRAPLAAQSRLFFLTVQSFVVSFRVATADISVDDLFGELATSLDHGLRPHPEG